MFSFASELGMAENSDVVSSFTLSVIHNRTSSDLLSEGSTQEALKHPSHGTYLLDNFLSK